MQLVFGRDAILNISYQANWKLIKDQKQKLIKKNNALENKNRKDYIYNVGDKVMIKQDQSAKYAKLAYKGPYQITKVHNNGTVNVQMDKVNDVYNVRNIYPYKE